MMLFRAFKDCAPLRHNVNPNGLDKNCYYCTVAALKNTDVQNLVCQTETMQQNCAEYGEIKELFRAAGFSADAYFLSGFNVGQGNNFCSATQMRLLLMGTLKKLGDCCGLGYVRPDHSGHMIVVGRVVENAFAPGAFKCADFQTSAESRRLEDFPPEGGDKYMYQAWLIDEVEELTVKFRKLSISD